MRGERRGQSRQGRTLFKFFLSCLKIWILFHCFLRFACHGNHLLEPSASTPPAPGWRTQASSHTGAGAAGGCLPRPCPSAPASALMPGSSSPGDTRMLGSGFCGWEWRLNTVLVSSWPPAIIKAAGPNAPVSTDIQAHTQANTHDGHACRDTFKYS